MKKVLTVLLMMFVLFLAGCSNLGSDPNDNSGKAPSNNTNPQKGLSLNSALEEAKKISEDIENGRFDIAKKAYALMLDSLDEVDSETFSDAVANHIIDHLNFISRDSLENRSTEDITTTLDGIRSIMVENKKLDERLIEYEKSTILSIEDEWEIIDANNADHINFNTKIVNYLKMLQADTTNDNHYTRGKMVTDLPGNIATYNVRLRGDKVLSINYFKDGEKMNDITLEIPIVREDDPEYKNWKHSVFSEIGTLIIALNPYMDNDESLELITNLTEFNSQNVDYTTINNMATHRGVKYKLDGSPDGLVFFAEKD